MSPLLLRDIGGYTYVIYAALCVVMGCYAYVAVPETAGVSLEAMDTLFAADTSGKRQWYQPPTTPAAAAAARAAGDSVNKASVDLLQHGGSPRSSTRGGSVELSPLPYALRPLNEEAEEDRDAGRTVAAATAAMTSALAAGGFHGSVRIEKDNVQLTLAEKGEGR